MLAGLLKRQVRTDEQIKGMLTSYNGKPAFFYQKSPPDNDENWNKNCYPRVDYNIDTQYNSERKSSGILTINIWCSSENLVMPEDIEKILKELIGGTFYNISEQSTICAIWNRSDAFSFESAMNLKNCGQPEVFGITILFELMEFPVQITTNPDPIQGINNWIKLNFPKLTVIEHDILPSVWKPTDECPAVYWRFIGSDVDSQNYSVVWFDGKFAAHIITDSVEERNRWLKAIAEYLQTAGEVMLQDGSPMFIKQIQIRHSADSLREGQLILLGQYGILAQQEKENAEIILNNINYSKGVKKMAKTTMLKEKLQNNESTLEHRTEKSNCKVNGIKSFYSVDELAMAARGVFGLPPEVVRAVLQTSGKKKITLAEAKDMVNKFLSREVK